MTKPLSISGLLSLALSATAWTLLLPAPGSGQTSSPEPETRPVTRQVTRAEAVAMGRENGPEVRAARSRTDAAALGVRAASGSRWPTVGFESAGVRSDDPVAAFGGRLRQGRFTLEDFDPARLNAPAPLTDWSHALGVNWAPLDLPARSMEDAARAGAQGAEAELRWIERAAGFRAEVRYLEAVGADAHLATTESARRAAEAHLALIVRRVEEGMLNEVDRLQAQAALEGARAAVFHAEQRQADARGQLALAMGWPIDVVPIPIDTSVNAAMHASAVGAQGHVAPATFEPLTLRPDLQAMAAAVAGAEARWAEARRARLPRVQGFAHLSTHASELFGSGEANWTLGAQLSIPLFTGFALGSRIEQARVLHDAAQTTFDEAHRAAETEVAEAARALAAASQRRAAVDAGADAAEEAARLALRRFEEGLMTTSELLAVEARAVATRNDAIRARLDEALAHARLRFLSPLESSAGFDS